MGARIARSGLFTQKQVTEAINHYFVPVEIDTGVEGVPEDAGGLRVHRWSYDHVPWTRVSFGLEAVLDPTGEILLGAPVHNHEANPKCRYSTINDSKGHDVTAIGRLFEKVIEDSLMRLARIRSHERGSPAEAEEIRKVTAEVDNDAGMPNHCMLDLHAATACTLNVLGQNVARYEARLSSVLESPEPKVLRQAAFALGHYAANSDEFRASEVATFVSDQLAQLLDEPDVAVRRSAATALFQIAGEPVPPLEDAELVSSAQVLWEGRG